MVTYSVSLVSSSLTLGKLKTFCTNVHAPLSDGISAAPTSQIRMTFTFTILTVVS